MTMENSEQITILVAVAHKHLAVKHIRTGIIGKDNSLPWPYIPEDMRRFRRITMGGALVMGRRTLESIGKPLPGRLNIVVSRQHKSITGCEVAQSPEAALDIARESGQKIFIIGGEQIYRHLMPYATVIQLTHLQDPSIPDDGDAEFPPINTKEWRMTSTKSMREYHGRFIVYKRVAPPPHARKSGDLV